MAGVAFLACLATLLVILVLACCKKMLGTFVGRMKLYITLVALLLSLTYTLQVLPVTTEDVLINSTNNTLVNLTRIKTKSDAWDGVCDTVGSLIVYVSWVMLLLIAWMVLLLLCYTKTLEAPPPPTANGSRSHRAEILGLVLTLTLPLLVIWVPYATDNYGLDGRWCGITLGSSCGDTDSSENNSPYFIGLIWQLILWYIPSIAITFITTIGLAVIIYRFRAYYEKHGFSGNTYSAIIKGIPPITYLVVYNIINVFNMMETTIFSTTDNAGLRYGFSVAHAVSGPCRALAVPFAFVLSQLIIYQCFKRRRAYISLL